MYDSYVPKAKKVIVNIDKNELNHANVKFDLKINDNVENFFRFFLNRKIRFKKDFKNFYNFKRLNWYEPKFEKKPNSPTIPVATIYNGVFAFGTCGEVGTQ